MTISTSANRIVASANSATTSFGFSFVGDSASDITVIYSDASGNQTTLLPAQYTLALNPPPAGGLWGIGGSVTYPISGTPLPTGTTLTIERILPLTQETAISNQGAFYANVTEAALDTLEMQIQQLNDALMRSFKAPVTDATFPLPVPPIAQRANLYAGWDSSGNLTALPGAPISGSASDISLYLSRTTIGTNLRTLKSRFADRNSAADFPNIDPTGVADSTAGLNAAIQAVLNQGGGELGIPPGQYLVSQLIIGTTGNTTQGFFRLYGLGRGAFQDTEAGYLGGVQFLQSSSVDTILVNGPLHVTLNDFSILPQTGFSPSAGWAIHALGGNLLSIKNVWLENNFNGILVDSSNRFEIIDTHIYYSQGTNALRLSSSLGRIDEGLVVNTFIQPAAGPTSQSATCDGIQIDENVNSTRWYSVVSNRGRYGIIIGTGLTSNAPSYHRFYAGSTENNLLDGIWIRDGRKIWFTDFYCALNNGNGAHLNANMTASNNGREVFFSNCNVEANGQHGFLLEGSPYTGINGGVCAANSNSGQGGTPNTTDNLHITNDPNAHVVVVGGVYGGDVSAGPGRTGAARYGVWVNATVTSPNLTFDNLSVAFNSTGGLQDNSSPGVKNFGKIIGYVGTVTSLPSPLINGSSMVWQRGTTFSFGAATPGDDGWVYKRASNVINGTASRQTPGPINGTQYYTRVQRTAGDTSTGQIYRGQVWSTADSIPWVGTELTLFFYARSGANFSPSGGALFSKIITGTGTDNTFSNMIAGGWAGEVQNSQSNTLTSTWTQFTMSAAITSTTTQIGIEFSIVPVGTAGSADYYDIGACGVSYGQTTPAFEIRPLALEMTLCVRRYRKSFALGTTPAQNISSSTGAAAVLLPTGATGTFGVFIPLQPPMRVAPTVTTFNTNTASASWWDVTNSASRTASVVTASIGDAGFVISGASGVAGSTNFIHWTADSEFT